MKLAKTIRTVTTAPIMAAILLTLVWQFDPVGYPTTGHYLMAMLFLAILPVLAYPVSVIVPALRRQGRDGQRRLAIIFSVSGYIGGLVFCLITRAYGAELLIYLTYFISGILIALFSFAIKFKASGHACGVSGPIAMLIHLLGPIYALGYIVLAAVFWASIKLKRHTWSQLIGGSAIPVITMLILISVL